MTEPWFARAFRAAYLDVYAHRDEAAAGGEVAFAADALDVACGAPVLDAGCGAGRHARALAARGVWVVGLDLSADLLAVAGGRGGGPVYVRGDLRQLPFGASTFAGVASFFTAFGYFDDPGNLLQLQEFRRVLRPRGRLVLDFLNAAHVAATLVPASARTQGTARIVERRRIREARVEKDVRVQRPGQPDLCWTESVRLYTEPDLQRLVRAAGFTCRSVHGDLAGGSFDAVSSRRCVMVAEAS